MKIVVSILFIILCAPLQAKELKSDQAVVLVNLDATSIGLLRFRSTNSKKGFRAKSYWGNKKTVTAGEYYLEKMTSIYSNIQPIRFDPPTSNIGKFVIDPGTVTYLGDWKIGTKFGGRHEYDGKIEFEMKSLKKYLRKYPYLKNYPLQIATDKGAIQKLDWNKLE